MGLIPSTGGGSGGWGGNTRRRKKKKKIEGREGKGKMHNGSKKEELIPGMEQEIHKITSYFVKNHGSYQILIDHIKRGKGENAKGLLLDKDEIMQSIKIYQIHENP